jgi:DNA-binding LytR/AlgR family response regulator
MLFKRKKIKTEMFEAENGKEALDIVLPNMDLYQIIFMDNLMPIMVNYIKKIIFH